MKCSYFIEENMRPSAQRLAFEVKYEYIVHQFTNISCVGSPPVDNDHTRRMKC